MFAQTATTGHGKQEQTRTDPPHLLLVRYPLIDLIRQRDVNLLDSPKGHIGRVQDQNGGMMKVIRVVAKVGPST
jgi:hypothetical protein